MTDYTSIFNTDSKPKGTDYSTIFPKTSNSTTSSLPQTGISANRGILGNILPIGGAVLGGIAGEILDPFGGGIPGALFGMGLAGAGGAAGEATQQVVEKAQGTRQSMNTNQIVENGAMSALGEGAGRVAAPVAKSVLKGVAFLGNVDHELMLQAFKDPKSLAPGFKGGTDFLSSTVRNIGDSLGKYSDALSTKFSNLIQPIASVPAKSGITSANNLISDTTKLLADRNISLSGFGGKVGQFTGDIPLSFEKVGLPSVVIAPGERKAVQTGFNLINGLRDGVPTVEKANAVIRTLGELRDFTKPGGDAAKEILGRMYHSVDLYIGKEFPQLAAARAEIKPSQMLLTNIREIVPQKSGANMTADEIDAAKSKLLNLFNASNSEAKKAVVQYGAQTGQKILDNTAGVKLGGQGLTGIAKVTPTSEAGVISKFTRAAIQAIPQIPIRFATPYTFAQHLLDNGVSENLIRTILQTAYQGKQKKD